MQTRVTHPTEKAGFPLMGAVATPLVEGADTAGAWEAVELALAPEARSPLHTLSTDKLFYVAQGTMRITSHETTVDVAAGGFVQVPAGVPHCYHNASGAAARMLVMTTGDTQVRFLRGMSRLSADGRPEPDALARHTAAHGVRILAPTGA